MEDKYYGILLEEMNSNFKLVLEGHTGLRNDINRVREELGEKIELNTTRIKALDEKLSTRIDAVEEKLSTRIDAVEEKLSTHIDAVGADLAAHRRDTEVHRPLGKVSG